jgi:16S rRNA (cytidine1402-2'-O)-methyltransferase
VQSRVAAGQRLKDVVAEVAAAAGVSKKALYDSVVAAKR